MPVFLLYLMPVKLGFGFINSWERDFRIGWIKLPLVTVNQAKGSDGIEAEWQAISFSHVRAGNRGPFRPQGGVGRVPQACDLG